MKISELEVILKELREKHGDLECGVADILGAPYPVKEVVYRDKAYWAGGGFNSEYIFIGE